MEKDHLGMDVEYEYIEVELSDLDVGKFEFIVKGKKDSYNIIGRGKVLIKRRRWTDE
ncbi:hypothetical protein [Paenibacillus sp. Marseille-Q4541]|uniref:hypothetical protein n=1 Tax=Paenibacillus sp. Marseille-Q4541 TaxID=2831522 RepID=UPI001BA5E25B|nr:hypothetical protein [Paenibacillus sp. Marseille-Q4541]